MLPPSITTQVVLVIVTDAGCMQPSGHSATAPREQHSHQDNLGAVRDSVSSDVARPSWPWFLHGLEVHATQLCTVPQSTDSNGCEHATRRPAIGSSRTTVLGTANDIQNAPSLALLSCRVSSSSNLIEEPFSINTRYRRFLRKCRTPIECNEFSLRRGSQTAGCAFARPLSDSSEIRCMHVHTLRGLYLTNETEVQPQAFASNASPPDTSLECREMT
jgi:hypothetical protein